MLDDELRQAAQDLRDRVEATEPPPFKAKSDFANRVILVAASIAVFVAAGLLMTFRQDDTTTAPASSSVEPTTDSQLSGEDPEPATADDQPVELSASGLVTDKAHRPRTEMDRPQIGEVTVEPEFATNISAVTNAPKGKAFVPVPGMAPSWNIDGSLLVLYETGETGGSYGLYDGTSFERLGDLPIRPVDVEQVMWDPVDTERLYYISSGALIARQVRTGSETTVHSFEGCDEVDTEGVGRPISSDGQRLAVRCVVGSDAWVAGLNIVTKAEVRIPIDDPSTILIPTPLGDSYLLVGLEGRIQVLDSTLEATGVEFETDSSDGVVVATKSGRQFYAAPVYDGPPVGSLLAFDIETGELVVAIGKDTGYPYPPSGTDLTASLANNGLVAVSVEGQSDPSSQGTLDGEVMVVDLNQAEPAVYRVGRHRTGGAINGLSDYFSDPFVDISPTGDRLLFSSSWNQDRVDTFVIDLTSVGS